MNKNFLIAGVLVLVAAAFVVLQLGPKPTGSSVANLAPGTIAEGVHYRALESELPVTDGIEVQEFFWYGCPHCQNFEPAIREYKKALPSDVTLVQIPVTWNEATSLHAAMHYVALESDDLEKLQDDLFVKIIALRKEGNLNKQIDEIQTVFSSFGFDADDFKGRLKSPEILAKVQSAADVMQAAGITGTPSMMVDNTWVVLNNEQVAETGLFEVVDHLIEKARAKRQ